MINKQKIVLPFIIVLLIMLLITLRIFLNPFVEEPVSQYGKMMEKYLNESLIQTDKNITAAKTNIVIDRGNFTILTIGIINRLDTTLNYKIRFDPIDGPSGAILSEFENSFQYSKDMIYTLSASDSGLKNIRLAIPEASIPGLYIVKLNLINNDKNNVYAQIDFFIEVK